MAGWKPKSDYSPPAASVQRLKGSIVESDMGQKWSPPKTEDDEVEQLIQLAADRRLALLDVRSMECRIISRFHRYLEEPTTRQ